MHNRSVSDPEEAHYNRMRVAKILGVAVAISLACCLGLFFGGAMVYSITRIGGPGPAAEAPPEIIVEREPDRFAGAPSAVVVEVLPDSPAEEAGLVVGDRIIAVEAEAMSEDQDLADFMAQYKPGDDVSLTVVRPGDGRIKVRVRLSEHPEKEGAAYLGVRYTSSQSPPGSGLGPIPFERHEGADPDDMPFFGVPGFEPVAGAMVISVVENSPASSAGLTEGDVITALDGQPIEGPQALVERLSEYEAGDRISLKVIQVGGGDERDLTVILGQHPDDPERVYLGIMAGDPIPMPGFEGWEMPEGFRRFRGQPFHFGMPKGQMPFNWEEWPREPGHFPFDWPEPEPGIGPEGSSA